jgi:hypothetical protein
VQDRFHPLRGGFSLIFPRMGQKTMGAGQILPLDERMFETV